MCIWSDHAAAAAAACARLRDGHVPRAYARDHRACVHGHGHGRDGHGRHGHGHDDRATYKADKYDVYLRCVCLIITHAHTCTYINHDLTQNNGQLTLATY